MSAGVITLGVTSCSMKLQTRTENSGANGSGRQFEVLFEPVSLGEAQDRWDRVEQRPVSVFWEERFDDDVIDRVRVHGCGGNHFGHVRRDPVEFKRRWLIARFAVLGVDHQYVTQPLHLGRRTLRVLRRTLRFLKARPQRL